MTPLLRASSSALVTTARAASRRSQRAARSSSTKRAVDGRQPGLEAPSRRCGPARTPRSRRRCTRGSAPSSRTSRSSSRSSVVCAARRPGASARRGVDAILDDVEVERAQIDGAEVHQPCTTWWNANSSYAASERASSCWPRCRIQRSSSGIDSTGTASRAGIEARQVAEQEAAGVADLAIALEQRRDEALREARVGGEVHRGEQQAQDVGAVLADDLVRRDDVAERLRHLLGALVEDEAVRQHPRYGALPVVATEVISETWNQPRC